MLTRRLTTIISSAAIAVCGAAVPAAAAPGDEGGCFIESGGGMDEKVYERIDIPCESGGMQWSPEEKCYYFTAENPPEGGEEVWVAFRPTDLNRATVVPAVLRTGDTGASSALAAAPGVVEFKPPSHHDGEGVWAHCGAAAPGRSLPAVMHWWWIPAGAGGVVVDPAVLARRAVEEMGIRASAIGMTGGDPPDGMQIIGIPAWMWLTEVGEQTTGPVTRSVSEGGVTVTATGVLDRTVWSMGDGSQVTCAGSAAPYQAYSAQYWEQPSPVCGHTYTQTSAGQPNQTYTVTMTAYWTVSWSGGGLSGTIPVSVSRSVPKMVGQVQGINTGPDGGK